MGDIHTSVALMHPALSERRDIVPFPGSGPPFLHGLGIFTGFIYHHGQVLGCFASYRPIVISLMVFVLCVQCVLYQSCHSFLLLCFSIRDMPKKVIFSLKHRIYDEV